MLNQNLEAMAKQLYDYWFGQFDFPDENGRPYKSSGGAMVWNEKLKREIPEIFEWCTLEDFIQLEDSKRVPLSSKERLDKKGIYPYYGATGIMDYVNDYIFDGDYLLLAEDGSTSDANGNPVVQYIWGKNWVNNHAHIILPKTNEFILYTYQLLKNIPAKMIETGSIQKKISQENLLAYKIILPMQRLIKYYCEIISPLWEQRKNNIEEILVLTKLRDKLLPLLMNGQVSVNSDLVFLYYIRTLNLRSMKENVIRAIVAAMQRDLDCRQIAQLKVVLIKELHDVDITESSGDSAKRKEEAADLLSAFISAKKIEGCSIKTLIYYRNTIERLLDIVDVAIHHITTSDIRQYLSMYQEQHKSSKVTIDNMRRIFSSFFAWLEDEDYIAKSPVRRIHKVKTDSLVKEVLSDEQLEQLRDNCTNKRDLAIIDILASTGIRVGELVKLNRTDIDFHERQCIVFGKGNKERVVYFNARTKLHLQQYLNERTDINPALFVSLSAPHNRLTIGGVEVRIRKMGRRSDIPKVHPHKFRRTLATMAIDKGMPIEQVQRLLGHVRIDTTLHYAIVNQNNVKIAHKKFLS